MRKFRVIVDLGMTLFDRNKRVRINGQSTYSLFDGAKCALLWWKIHGHELFIVSKIDPGTEERVLQHLRLSYIVPDAIEKQNVFFCHKREEKGEIAKRIGADVCIDDRVQALNSMDDAGVQHKILFTGGHDDRKEHALTFTDIFVCDNWIDVERTVEHLP